MTLIQWKDISRNAARTFGVLLLPTTKSGQRFGYAGSVPISDPTLLDRCMTESFHHAPGDRLVTMAPGQFRRSFADGCLAIGLPDGIWKPYSIRRGGATQHFREHGSLDATCVRGRWSNAKTCRININDSIAAATALRVTDAESETLRTFAAAFD